MNDRRDVKKLQKGKKNKMLIKSEVNNFMNVFNVKNENEKSTDTRKTKKESMQIHNSTNSRSGFSNDINKLFGLWT